MVANSSPDPDKPKHPGGRPTKYRPEMCEQIIEAGRIGKGKAAMAAELDVDRVTLYTWDQTIPEFHNAFTRALELSAAWWEEKGRTGIDCRNFNANAYSLQVRNRFPEDWQDKRELGLSAGQDFFDSLMDDKPESIEAGPVIDIEPDTVETEGKTPQDDGAGEAGEADSA